jgi:hypothetical protein
MSFCCGASMIGAKGTLKHVNTHIHNVPLLFCPVCHRVEVHFRIETEYEILAEYAHSDGAAEVDFEEYAEPFDEAVLFENCVNSESDDPITMVRNQIDMALDLLPIAKALKDEEWEKQLKKRLIMMNDRRNKLLQKMSSSGNKKR